MENPYKHTDVFIMLLALQNIDIHHLNIVLMMGIVVFGGIVGAKLFQLIKVPQVIGYIVIGLIIGESVLGIVPRETIETLKPLNYFALGIIGFIIGGELKLDMFRRFGKQFTAILIAEGVLAFLLVGAGATFICLLFGMETRLALAVGIVLGAISSATDPASTIQVLWEYKSRGMLTTAVTAIVALDDALALTLYGIGTAIAGILAGGTGNGVTVSLLYAFLELGGALVLGLIGGTVLLWILRKTYDLQSVLAFAIGSVLLVLGLSIALNLDVILASMAMGLFISNVAPNRSKDTFELVHKFAPPIYVMFFVFVGAGIQVSNLSTIAWVLVLVYVVGRSLGKMFGSTIGAKIVRSQPKIQKYLGMCLFAQGGVAVGLCILAGQRFSAYPEVGELIVLVVAATTLVVQFLGPAFVKLAVTRSGEAGLNITEEDLLTEYAVKDVMEKSPAVIRHNFNLNQILDTFRQSNHICYPVVNHKDELIGVITINGIRETFMYQEAMPWLLAEDLMRPVGHTANSDELLNEAVKRIRESHLDYMCVASGEPQKLEGLLDYRRAMRKLNAEIIRRRELVDQSFA
jgi:Kef-type K+ transport system membrane component KefB